MHATHKTNIVGTFFPCVSMISLSHLHIIHFTLRWLLLLSRLVVQYQSPFFLIVPETRQLNSLCLIVTEYAQIRIRQALWIPFI